MRIARFQYSLRLLMLGIFVASAVVISIVSLRSTIELESVLGSPLVFVYCIAGLLLFTTLGDAVAGRAGAAISAVFAAAIWLLLLYRLLVDMPDDGTRTNHFLAHTLVAGVTAVSAVTFILLRRDRPVRSDEDNETVKQLLDFQQSRRNRK